MLALHPDDPPVASLGGIPRIFRNIEGFRRAMEQLGIDLVQTQVGDRYVLEELRSRDWALGGEQSGHLVDGRLTTTGDGLLTAVQLAHAIVADGRPVSRQLVEYVQRLRLCDCTRKSVEDNASFDVSVGQPVL